jgi:molybdopterin-guanine dinucleotide biosynthesis protein A
MFSDSYNQSENKNTINISAAILAGGRNRRFGGRIKSLEKLKDKFILSHQLDVLKEKFDEILLITNQPESFKDFREIKKYPDVFPYKGPLAGIHSAMYHSSSGFVFIVAGDMPFLNGTAIDKLVNFCGHRNAVIPVSKNGTEPLHGIYNRKLLQPLESFIKNSEDLSVQAFLDDIKPYYVKVTEYKIFININSPQELKKYEED